MEVVSFYLAQLRLLLTRLWSLVRRFCNSIYATSSRRWLCKLLVCFHRFLLLLATRSLIRTLFAYNLGPLRTQRLVQISPSTVVTGVESARSSLSLLQVIDKLALLDFIRPVYLPEIVALRHSWTARRKSQLFRLLFFKVFSSVILCVQENCFQAQRLSIKSSVWNVVV